MTPAAPLGDPITATFHKRIVLHVALWEPEIPPNTGNIARLCAATGAKLHLIGRLGFQLDDRHLRRAGLDYWPDVDLTAHNTWNDFVASQSVNTVWLLTSKSSRIYTSARFRSGDCLLFGSESHGAPASMHERFAETALTIPMPTGKVRSLNLATAVGIVLYEALRQTQSW